MEVDNCIEHKGVVKEIVGGKAIVRLIDELTCASCSAKGSCMSLSEKQDKLFEFDAVANNLSIGNMVKVKIQKSKGTEALFYGYMLPLILLIFTLVGLKSFNIPDGKAGTISLLTLLPYYGILYLFNKKLKQRFSFYIEKIDE